MKQDMNEHKIRTQWASDRVIKTPNLMLMTKRRKGENAGEKSSTVTHFLIDSYFDVAPSSISCRFW